MKAYAVTIKIRSTKAIKYLEVEAENEATAKTLAISYAKTMCPFTAIEISEIK